MSQKYRVFVTLIKLTTSTFNHKKPWQGPVRRRQGFL